MGGIFPTRHGQDASAALVSRCDVAPWELASVEFQDDPQPVNIIGARESEGSLFGLLDRLESPQARGSAFHEYLAARFQLDQWGDDNTLSTPLRHSYLRFLRGWGVDSNGRSGAALKAWVESRFGLRPTWHGGVLASNPEAKQKYLEDRMRGEAETMGLGNQMDLLYTYCQDELRRRHTDTKWLTLYRGTHDPQEYSPRKAHDGNGLIVELNNLSSFSSNREIAWEFGSIVWEARIPLPKIVFFSGLLPRSLLDGEKEHLVLGGEYRVRRLLC